MSHLIVDRALETSAVSPYERLCAAFPPWQGVDTTAELQGVFRLIWSGDFGQRAKQDKELTS